MTTMISLPTLVLDEVYHTGTFDPGDKGMHGRSLEGRGLSVCLDMDAWQQIARLPGDEWCLRKTGARFVDAHAVDDAAQSAIVEWAKRKGLVTDGVAFRYSWEDSETEEVMFSLAATYDEAVAECEEVDEDPETAITEVPVLLPSGRLCEMVADGTPGQPSVMMADWLLIAYVESSQDYDGIWWEDNLDVDRLSAPRGVIPASRIDQWSRAPFAATMNGDMIR